jgi:hypothetical protein
MKQVLILRFSRYMIQRYPSGIPEHANAAESNIIKRDPSCLVAFVANKPL